ncbi:MAG TPA: helix-turn-helix domain-containing protein [Pseudonocardiaceae bacterium]
MLVELSVVEQRYHAVMEVVSGGIPVVEVAERYGVSRKTVHAWLRRYRQEGLPGLGWSGGGGCWREPPHRAHRGGSDVSADLSSGCPDDGTT